MKTALALVLAAFTLTVALSLTVGASFVENAYRFLVLVLALLVEIDWCAVFILKDVAKRHPELAILKLQYERAIVVAVSSTLGFLLGVYHMVGLYAPPYSIGLGLLIALSAMSLPSLFWLWTYFTDGFDK
jgi:hypothetical protein